MFVGLLLAATCALYARAVTFDFVSFDDPLHVVENPVVREGLTLSGIGWAFSTFHSFNWMPLTWISFMADAELFGLSSWGYHLTNVILHAANTALVFTVLHRMTGKRWPAAFVAVLFASHPTRVESVAWISERKDVLSTFFWMSTLWAYTNYVETARRNRYVLTLVLFALGLMAKPMLVTLPVILLLLDVWPLRRADAWRGLVAEKVPFLALSFLVSAVTVFAQRAGGALATLDHVSLAGRCGRAIESYAWYLGKLIWPTDLAFFYPYTPLPSVGHLLGLAVLLAIISAAVIIAVSSRPYLATGWFWYLVTLLPVIGLVQVGGQAHADRFTYVPSIGLLVMVAFAGDDLVWHWPRSRPAVALLAGAAILAAMISTSRQLPYWATSIALYERALAVTRDNPTVHHLLAAALAERGDAAGAVFHYEEALRIRPRFPAAQVNLGNILASKGKVEEAIVLYRAALRDDPRSAIAHFNLGRALAHRGDIAEALAEYREALRLNPDYPEAHYWLATLLAKQGDLASALTHYREALRARPAYPEARHDLGNLLSRMGRLTEALAEYRAALRTNPAFPEAHFNLGRTLEELGDLGGAADAYARALELRPDLAEAHYFLGQVLERQGEVAEAARHYGEALRLNPRSEETHRRLAEVLRVLGDTASAARHLAIAEELRATSQP